MSGGAYGRRLRPWPADGRWCRSVRGFRRSRWQGWDDSVRRDRRAGRPIADRAVTSDLRSADWMNCPHRAAHRISLHPQARKLAQPRRDRVLCATRAVPFPPHPRPHDAGTRDRRLGTAAQPVRRPHHLVLRSRPRPPKIRPALPSPRHHRAQTAHTQLTPASASGIASHQPVRITEGGY